MFLKKVTIEEVKACKFKPEPHTVALKDEGEWWAIIVDDEIASVLCVSNKHGGKYYSEVYTAPKHRGKGYSSALVSYVANNIYNKDYQIAHCLLSSKNIFERAGFSFLKLRKFKHGDQYFMERKK